MSNVQRTPAEFGDNSNDTAVSVEVRLFNSVTRYARDGAISVRTSFPAGSDVREILARFGIPADEVFLILVNGRDITPYLRSGVRTSYVLDHNDVIALSGPVPYSWGYGSPVV